jgi:glycosyltransferase involved in cell wall biosynthesis
VFVGRLMPHKGVDRLICGLPADVPLRVIGRPYDTAYRDCLHELAAGKPVTFEEDATDEDILSAYRSARVSVLPSQYRPLNAPPSPNPELLGLTLIEAMACGTPVVCTDVGGMPEVVESGVTGLVVEPSSSRALGAAVARLTRDDATWSSMASNARRIVEQRFTWNAVAERCLAAYDAPAGR